MAKTKDQDRVPSTVEKAVRRGARAIVVPANPVTPLLGTVRDVASSAERIYGLASRILRPERADPALDYLARIADDRARFQAAMAEHGRTETDLPGIERMTSRALWMWAVMLVLGIAYAICSIRWEWKGTVASAFAMVAPWSFLLFLMARFARASFRHYQVRLRALVPVRVWLADPWSWLSGPAHVALVLLGAIAGASLLHPGLALAQGVNASNVLSQMTTATGTSDLSFLWMQRLFPASVQFWLITPSNFSGQGNPNDIFASLFQIFNSVLFAVGAVMMCWHTVVGMVHTAHTGKVLGDRWHTTWAPMRVIWGVGNLAPINGYCMAQILVINLLLGGYSLANLEWNTYVQSVMSPSGTIIIPPQIDATQTFAAQVLRAETCLAVLQAYQNSMHSSWNPISILDGPRINVPANGQPPTSGTPVSQTTTGTTTPMTTAQVWDYGPVCGSLKLNYTTSGALTAAQNSVAGGKSIVAPASSSSNLPDVTDTSGLAPTAGMMNNEYSAIQTFDSSRQQAVAAFVAAVRNSGLPQLLASGTTCCNGATAQVQSASQLAANKQAFNDLQQVMAAATTMNNSIAGYASSFSQSMGSAANGNFKAAAATLGWASAGAMNYTLARMSSEAADHVSGAMPVGVDVNPLALSSDLQSEAVVALATAKLKLETLLKNSLDSGYVSNANLTVTQDKASLGVVAMALKPIGDGIARSITDSMNLNEVAPMSSMIALGNSVLNVSETVLGGFVAARVLAAGAEKGTESGFSNILAAPFAGILEGFRTVTGFILSYIGIIMAFGALNAFVLPMASYFIWTFAVMGCAIFAAEVVIAAPIAAFMHIRMDGAEMINHEQRSIYGIVFNAFLRPTLLLFGLILSNLVFSVMASYVNRTFGVAMISSQGNTMVGVVGIGAMFIMLAYLHYQLAIRSFALIHETPRLVARILQVDDGERGEGHHGTQVFAAAGGFSKNFITGGVAKALGGNKPEGGNKPRNDDADKDAAKAKAGGGAPGGAAPNAGPTGPAAAAGASKVPEDK